MCVLDYLCQSLGLRVGVGSDGRLHGLGGGQRTAVSERASWSSDNRAGSVTPQEVLFGWGVLCLCVCVFLVYVCVCVCEWRGTALDVTEVCYASNCVWPALLNYPVSTGIFHSLWQEI